MKTMLVNLVSKQTIPNVLFIREMKNEIDSYIFITTKDMESKNKTTCIINASGVTSSTRIIKIEVQEDSITNIYNKLKKEIPTQQDISFLVNLTGGTKIMSIGVYNFFTERNSDIYYIPIGKNICKRIFTKKNTKDCNLNSVNYRIGLKDYLTAYGVEIQSSNLLKDEAETLAFFNLYINRLSKDKDVLCFINELREQRGRKKIKLSGNQSTCLEKSCFTEAKKGFLNKYEIEYLTGGWFEEFIYTLAKKRFELTDNAIGVNIEINRNKVQNEFDVMYTNENSLYIIECKTGVNNKTSGKSILNDTLYKMSALRKDFGLFVKSSLYTLSNLRDINGQYIDNYLNRANTLGIELNDAQTISELSKKFHK